MSLVDAVGDSAKSGDLDILGGWAPMTDGYVVRMGPPFIYKQAMKVKGHTCT